VVLVPSLKYPCLPTYLIKVRDYSSVVRNTISVAVFGRSGDSVCRLGSCYTRLL
jgi:hypothetical protein